MQPQQVRRKYAPMTAPTARIIVVSDRIHSGEREDSSTPAARSLLDAAGFETTGSTVVPEGEAGVAGALDEALAAGASLVLTCGGTGLGPSNLTPEVSLERISTRLHGVETNILIEGLAHSERAGLCRGVVGLTSREPGGSLIVNAPSSRGGIRDTLTVILRLWPSLTEWVS